MKERAVAHLGGRCKLCGYNKCLAALEFHHEDPETKDFTISASMSWARIEAELAKTILVCSNCHREIHAGNHPQYLSFVDSYDEGFVDGPSL